MKDSIRSDEHDLGYDKRDSRSQSVSKRSTANRASEPVPKLVGEETHIEESRSIAESFDSPPLADH